VRKAKDEYENKLTSELLHKDIPPGKWWRIAKSISNFTSWFFTFKIVNWSKHSCSVIINSFKLHGRGVTLS
jgi:hypothetical protein